MPNLDDLKLEDNLDGSKLPTETPPTDDKKDDKGTPPNDNLPVDKKPDETKPNNTPAGKNDDEIKLVVNPTTGDIVDEQGRVYIKKADIKKDAAGNVIIPDDLEPVETPMIEEITNQLQVELGLELKREDGTPFVFDNTTKGIADLVKAAAEIKQVQAEKEFFEAYPQVVSIVRHLNAGGDINSYFDVSTRYRKTEIPAETDKNKDAIKSLRRELIIENEVIARSGGLPNDQKTKERLAEIRKDAEDYADFIFSRAQEGEIAKKALANLQNYEVLQERARDERNNAVLAEREKAIATYWEDVNKIVKAGRLTGKLGDIQLADKERQDFLDYISKDANGKRQSQEMLDVEQEDMQTRLMFSFLRYKKFDLTELVKRQIRTEKQKNLEQMREANKGRTRFKLEGSTNNANTNVGGSEISLNNLLDGKI